MKPPVDSPRRRAATRRRAAGCRPAGRPRRPLPICRRRSRRLPRPIRRSRNHRRRRRRRECRQPAGFLRARGAGLPGEPPFRYLVQLPPEYDPYRRYPTIVTLHGAGTTATQQIDWWAGARTETGWRAGQADAARLHRHRARLDRRASETVRLLRPRTRRRAELRCATPAGDSRIDTDRVFLTGHSMGGDAAWDIGLAHPDLWAGRDADRRPSGPLLRPLLGKRQDTCRSTSSAANWTATSWPTTPAISTAT